MAPDPAWYAVYYRFLETRDESFPYDADPDEPPSQGRWRIHGLGLPDDVLRKVYRENARASSGSERHAAASTARWNAGAYGLLTIRAVVDTIPADPRTSVARRRPARGSFVPSRPSGGTLPRAARTSGVRPA